MFLIFSFAFSVLKGTLLSLCVCISWPLFHVPLLSSILYHLHLSMLLKPHTVFFFFLTQIGGLCLLMENPVHARFLHLAAMHPPPFSPLWHLRVVLESLSSPGVTFPFPPPDHTPGSALQYSIKTPSACVLPLGPPSPTMPGAWPPWRTAETSSCRCGSRVNPGMTFSSLFVPRSPWLGLPLRSHSTAGRPLLPISSMGGSVLSSGPLLRWVSGVWIRLTLANLETAFFLCDPWILSAQAERGVKSTDPF